MNVLLNLNELKKEKIKKHEIFESMRSQLFKIANINNFDFEDFNSNRITNISESFSECFNFNGISNVDVTILGSREQIDEFRRGQ